MTHIQILKPIPRSNVEATQILSFLLRCTKRSVGNKVQASIFYEAYRDYCRTNGLEPCTVVALGNFRRTYIQKTKKSCNSYWRGFELIDPKPSDQTELEITEAKELLRVISVSSIAKAFLSSSAEREKFEQIKFILEGVDEAEGLRPSHPSRRDRSLRARARDGRESGT